MYLLQAKDVSQYFGGLCAVSHFSLDLRPGELMGIIGPNGAGKTTVFNVITGVYRASKGSITYYPGAATPAMPGTGVQGEARASVAAETAVELVGRTPSQIVRLGIARTFQNIRLFRELSVLDNVRIAQYGRSAYNPLEALLHAGRYGAEERRIADTAMELLALFRLESYADEISKNLPYGQQRRLEIARALATQPRLLLLDEPAAGMNPAEIGQLMEFIQWVRQRFSLTIILIEHQMRLVMGICERIKVLDFGGTIAEGLPQEIRQHPRVLEAYLGPQEDDVYAGDGPQRDRAGTGGRAAA